MPEPVIRLENITRTFIVGDTEVHALAGVDLVIEPGEFVAIAGASGSGKSTLMSILGCLDRPSRGNYFFEGVDVAKLAGTDLARIRSARLGFVFQSFNLLMRASALENVALPLYYAVSGPVRRQSRTLQAGAALKLLGLGGRERNTPGQLSGGQQQRVAIARALINAPGLLLADEPTGNLDTYTSHEIMETLVSLNRERGVTVALVTHEADIAAYADRVLTMRDGLIVSDKRTPGIGRLSPGTQGSAPFLSGAAAQPSSASAGGAFALGTMILSTAVQSIMRNKMRSVLTMLGVLIGVAALIVMVAVGQGADEAVRKQIESLGTNVAVILPGAISAGGARSGFGSASTLTIEDARAISQEAPAIARTGYLILQQGQVQSGSRNWITPIQGVSASYPPITNWRIASGRAITEEDENRTRRVAVIGQTVYRQLFGPGDNPVGATIQAKGVPLEIIGVLASKGQSPLGQDQDDLIMTPFTTAERKILGTAAPNRQVVPVNWPYPQPPNPYNLQARLTGFVNVIFVQAVSADWVQAALDQVNGTLMRRHRIKPGAVKDFDVRNLSQFVETAERSSQILRFLLAAVASVSLLVGGIGIMNILLVSVTERTREIGLRMAIGAQRQYVLFQFLAEAVIMSVSGGIAGIVLGMAGSFAIALAFGWPGLFSLTAAAGGFLFAAAVGVFFGYYPAHKAASLNPIEALRYE
jgi:macrolide transport system ATP-binding/permease protein